MLFNSYGFIFVFLPLAFAGMFWLGRYNQRWAAAWLGLASLAFYAAWDARFVLLLLTSIVFNYGAGCWLESRRAAGKGARYFLAAAITADLLLLGYFKYANFFIDTANQLSGSRIAPLDIVLPLGISFFTFTQIAFLVDVHRGIAREYSFIHYLLFVTWFPHLIAGPVLHHRQMMPQLSLPAGYRINAEHVSAGLTIFVLGLAKKVLVADNLADYASPVFDAASAGHTLALFEAWAGALAYTLQLYFDFSGYSDMAIGLSLMFNVRLPLNFDSPYKATSIIDFWRRWHMTLSAFLREYLYIPLGGNRKGKARRYINLMATMLLGGLWHGSGWTFIVWGGLHGLYLIINHGWRELKARLGRGEGGWFARLAARTLTFLAVVVAWVFFRADSFASAQSMLSGMAGINGVSLPTALEASLAPSSASSPAWVTFRGMFPATLLSAGSTFGCIALGLVFVWLFPNTRQIMRNHKHVWEDIAGRTTPIPREGMAMSLVWQPSVRLAWMFGTLFLLCVFSLTRVSEFLYFQF
jgi:D-alanyl-lipoteichoic acid acyltransferase DltB (MBOAT superfamily)